MSHRKDVLVVGDVMLDVRIEGAAQRISPEAPVPILQQTSCSSQLGGAGNVAANLGSLGCKTWLLGLVGADPEAEAVRAAAELAGIRHGLQFAAGPTITKTRVTCGGQQLLRVDREQPFPLENHLSQAIAPMFEHPHELAAVVVSDYAKGTMTPELCRWLIERCNTAGVPLFVDARPDRLRQYTGAWLIKVNHHEALQFCSDLIHPVLAAPRSREAVEHLTEVISLCLNAPNVVITCGPDGLVGRMQDGQCFWPANQPRPVYDVTGAGDSVLATLVACHLQGASFVDSLAAAEVAGSLAVQQHGLYHATWAEIITAERQRNLPRSKRVLLPQAVQLAALYRDAGKRIVLTNGCFDGLHPGHYALLDEAKQHGDVLFVAYNDDASVKAIKGETRPLYAATFRERVLSELSCVDVVFPFDGQTQKMVSAINPHVLVKGAEYVEQAVPGADLVASRGGTVVFVNMVPGYSTTELVAKLTPPVEETASGS